MEHVDDVRERGDAREQESRSGVKRFLLVIAFYVVFMAGALQSVPLGLSRAAAARNIVAYGLAVSALVLIASWLARRIRRPSVRQGRPGKSLVRGLLEALGFTILLMLVVGVLRTRSLLWNVALAVGALMFWGVVVVPLVDKLSARHRHGGSRAT